ncbi:MAG: HlyD family efflux transporter periplasmic adaptor subunit [Acidobacteriia bacterium]|nr:HlyD family efflux transporter periplasmic adaptor subunit [Terriglobia bacterium]
MASSPSSAPAPGPVRGPQVTLPQPVTGPKMVPPKPPEKRRIALWGIPLAVVLLGGGLALYLNSGGKAPAKGGPGGPGSSVPMIAVGLGDVHRTVRVNGTVAARNFAALLAPRIQGSRSGMNRGGDSNFGGGPGGGGGGDFVLVLLHLAKPGIHVKAGDVVAEFDPTNQLLRLDDFKDTVVQLENTIKKMMANLAATKEAHDQTVRTAKADWDKAVLDLKTAPIRSQIDQEKFKLAVEEAQAKYKQLVAETALVDESQRAQIRSSELNRDQSRIEMQRAEVNVQRMTIKSPMDGIVVMGTIPRNGEFGQIREGDQIGAGQPFMSIVDPSSMVLNAAVNQVDAERLRLGMKGSIRLDAYPEVELPGSLLGIGAMSKTSTFRASYVGEIPVRIKIEKSDPRLIPDLTGSAEIVLGSEMNALVAPRAAVFEEDGGSFVFVQGPQGFIRKPVELGLASFTAVAIHSGLQKGDVVALQRPM